MENWKKVRALEEIESANNDLDGADRLRALRSAGRRIGLDLKGIRTYREMWGSVEVWDTNRSGGCDLRCPSHYSASDAKADYIEGLIRKTIGH